MCWRDAVEIYWYKSVLHALLAGNRLFPPFAAQGLYHVIYGNAAKESGGRGIDRIGEHSETSRVLGSSNASIKCLTSLRQMIRLVQEVECHHSGRKLNSRRPK